MPTGGRFPKRSEERRRRNEYPGETRSAPILWDVEIPSLPSDTHPIARRLYESLALSGQARYYEPSDWAWALLCAERTSTMLENPRNQPQMVDAINKLWAPLLITEGERRRARLEVVRHIEDPDEKAAGEVMERYLQHVSDDTDADG